LNSKQPDGDSVKETSPHSKFLGICTTIQGHDLFAIPINKIVAAPAFHQAFFFQTFANLSFPFPPLVHPKNLMAVVIAGAAPATRRKEAAQALVGGGDRQLPLRFLPDFVSISNDPLLFQAHPVEPAPAPANPALPNDSSKLYNYSPVPYGERDNLHFKAERDESRRKLGQISKKACITELEWEDQRKQLLETINGISL
jgi:hypothetical protein